MSGRIGSLNDLEELRRLRELVAGLQFGLLNTLNLVEALGAHMGAGKLFAEEIQATKQTVMNLLQQPDSSRCEAPENPVTPVMTHLD